VKKALAIAAAIAVFGFLVVRLLTAEAAVECEACMVYAGRRACASVAAPDRMQAEARSVSQVCSILTSGVTRSLECERQAPQSLSCRER
jgi:hypothetical protein